MEISILSLGAGVQSTTVLLMACKGELPKPDCAIFADTQWEPKAVYEHLSWLEQEAAEHGIPVYRVTSGNIRSDALTIQVRGKKTMGRRFASMPFFVNGSRSGGMIKRQCTSEYKIKPIEKFIRQELLGLLPRRHIPRGTSIEHWFGISMDEKQRTRMSVRWWEDFHYPLITTKPMVRGECIKWLRENYPNRIVPRSACIGCPFHSDAEWRKMRADFPSEWREAVEFDKAMRRAGGMRGEIFLHRSRCPLGEVDIDSHEDRGQTSMEFSEIWKNECTGRCFV